jgi:hypothetical protein
MNFPNSCILIGVDVYRVLVQGNDVHVNVRWFSTRQQYRENRLQELVTARFSDS